MTAISVDQGDPPGVIRMLAAQFTAAPGRLSNTARVVALVLLTVTISETFRMPETALSAFIVLFVSKSERGSTVMTAAAGFIAGAVGIMAAIVVFMASLSEPGLRLPLIAGVTFLALFAARASPLGPVLFPAGFVIAYGLTLGDEVFGLSLQPGLVSNTTEAGLPQLAFMPPEDALVRFLLWMGAAIGLPVGLVILANLLTGRDPARLLRSALAERLTAAARLCAGEVQARDTVVRLTREGTAELRKLHGLSRPPRRVVFGDRLIEAVERLSVMLLAAGRLPSGSFPPRLYVAIGRRCARAGQAVAGGMMLQAMPLEGADAVVNAAGVDAAGGDAAARPLAAEMLRTLEAIEAAVRARAEGGPEKARPKPRLLVADAFVNPAYYQFALKATLCVMLCYAIQDLTDWPGIHTCVITCFFVSLGTVGETLHKAALRITGCLFGAALAVVTILVFMPMMQDLVDLLMALAVVTFLAAWIGFGSERVAYAGLQIGLAFYLAILQGYGPTLDMETAKDRIVGIIIGNLAVGVIFTFVWPARVAGVVRSALAQALEQLAGMLELQGKPEAEADAAEPALWQGFEGAIAKARAAVPNEAYEVIQAGDAHPRPVDARVLLQVQALMVPVSALLTLRKAPGWAAEPEAAHIAVVQYQGALAAWLRRCGEWARTGVGGDDMARQLPVLPAPLPAGDDQLAARAVWWGRLEDDLRVILDEVSLVR